MRENLNHSEKHARWSWVMASLFASHPVMMIATYQDRVIVNAFRASHTAPIHVNDNKIGHEVADA